MFIHLTRFLTTLSLALFLAQSSLASEPLENLPSGDYELDLSHGSILWKVNHVGFSTYIGRFTDFAATIDLNTSDLSNSAVAVDIKTESIDTGYPYPEKEDFDKKLSGDWLKSAEFPSITFNSTSVSALDGNRFTVQGELSFLGVSRPVTLNATLNKAVSKHPFSKKPTIGFSATTEFDRTQWGSKNYAPNIVGAEIKVEIEGEFVFQDKR